MNRERDEIVTDDGNGFRGRKVVVTGGARGIGYAIARAAARAGAAVALIDLEHKSLDEAAAKLGINPSTLYRKRKRYGI